MDLSMVSQIRRNLTTPETTKRFSNTATAILFIPLIEAIVVPSQILLSNAECTIPASVIVMLGVLLFMLVANTIHGGVDSCYKSHLKGPTDFLGRHMSLGFVTSFVMLNKDHIQKGIDVPRIAMIFLITSVVGYVGPFLFALGSSKLERRVRGLNRRAQDTESKEANSSSTIPNIKADSSGSQLAFFLNSNVSQTSTDSGHETPSTAVEFVVRAWPIWLTALLMLTVGLPIVLSRQTDTPLELFIFILFWIVCVQFQRLVKTWRRLHEWPQLHSALVVLANPVLLASGLGTIYFWVKVAVTGHTADRVLASFRHYNNLAQVFIALAQNDYKLVHVGAGDLVNTLLDAGIVSLGLKMFEYRRELWESSVTVFLTSLVTASINVFMNVALAHAVGLARPEALAFAARSVTIALGSPAVSNLGGSITLQSALCIFSGMMFQIIGDLLFKTLRIHDHPSRTILPLSHSMRNSSPHSREKPRDGETGLNSDSENDGKKSRSGNTLKPRDNDEPDTDNECKVIAAGVTVGISGAAMGTSYLIERDSTATAYSALSMTVFGAITVAFTAVPAISEILISMS